MGAPVDVVGLSLVDIDYLAIGNPTIDLLADNSEVIGGTVSFAAVQAARYGLRARVLGRADNDELAPLLPPHDDIIWDLQAAPCTTRFRNVSLEAGRTQYVYASAGPVELDATPLDARVIHLGPIAAETDFTRGCELAHPDAFVGATPQGAFRYWGDDNEVRLQPIVFDPVVLERCQVVVAGNNEADVAAQLLDGVVAEGGIAVVTYGSRGCVVRSSAGEEHFDSPLRVEVVDDTGAGDVFAATLFIGLADGRSLADSVLRAQLAAAACVQGIGVDTVPTTDELEALVTMA